MRLLELKQECLLGGKSVKVFIEKIEERLQLAVNCEVSFVHNEIQT